MLEPDPSIATGARRRLQARSPRAHRSAAALTLSATLAACGGGGSGTTATSTPTASLGAADLGVLIAAGNADSEAIGAYYQTARGIPAANIIRVTVPAGSDVISASDFATLKASIDAQLPATVQATLVTWTQPSRVLGSTCSMGLTSALAFGYNANYCASSCNTTLPSAYYDSDSSRPFADLGIRPSMMLGATSVPQAQALIDRGVSADRLLSGGRATGQAWLVRTSDAARSSPRYADFQALAATSVPGLVMNYVDNSAGTGSDLVTGQSQVMFYFTGLPAVAQITSNAYLPGAVGDNLTSSGGYLPDGNGQTTVTAWLQAGVTAAYGTVEEPCAFASKFARASILLKHYQRGETLLESYWKSVQMPGQGLFVGEPLARPWAP